MLEFHVFAIIGFSCLRESRAPARPSAIGVGTSEVVAAVSMLALTPTTLKIRFHRDRAPAAQP